jgi:hypothetical protein
MTLLMCRSGAPAAMKVAPPSGLAMTLLMCRSGAPAAMKAAPPFGLAAKARASR